MRRFWLTAFLSGVLVLTVTSIYACGCAPSSDSSLTMAGPWDLYHLSWVINHAAQNDPSVPSVVMKGTANSLDELRRGRCDIAVMGREPADGELDGLVQHVIAYDAVVFIIDANSYEGGEWIVGGRIAAIGAGMRELSFSDLQGIFSYWIKKPEEQWLWIDKDPDRQISGLTAPPVRVVSPMRFPPGKYDTQTVVYRTLGIDEDAVVRAWSSFSTPKLNMEEEVLSFEYPPDSPYQPGTGNFKFKLCFASRRVVVLALKYIPVKVVAIDGLDVVRDPEAVYEERYPFSRKIRLVTRQNPNPKVVALVDYLLSPDGQELLTRFNYLPLDRGVLQRVNGG